MPLDLALGFLDLPEAQHHQAHIDGIGGDANNAEIIEHEEQDRSYLKGENNPCNSGFPIRNNRGQKEVTQHFSSARLKELPVQNSIYSENSFRNGGKIKAFWNE